MNPDLEIERRNPPFNIYALSCLLHGGKEVYDNKCRIADFVESTPDFDNPKELVFMTREERYENAMRKTVAVMKHAQEVNITSPEESGYYMHMALNSDTTPIHLHHVMFLPAIQGQGSDEQREKWLPLALTYSIIGTYAQTELGHGTNLKKLETTATYDAETQEFILNSPTLTSTKWWPGNLGKSSNYAVVLAQLYTKGSNHGVHAFLVQLRDMDTHKPLPGIIVGDIGPKFGIASNDNGFLRLNHVRIPREHMLMRFAKVEPDGTYIKPKHEKLVYGAMVHVRSNMLIGLSLALGICTTIATRYSCVRRQGEMFEGKGEVKLLDYQTQQYRLFPELAKVYAFLFAATHLREMYNQVSSQIQQGDVDQLPALHVLSAGLKAYVTFEVCRGIEICRLSCGGHGYSKASGLPEYYGNVAGSCTYEGDNIVMLLQVARQLVKTVRQKSKDPLSSYLWKPRTSKSALDGNLRMDDLLDIYEHAAQRTVLDAVAYLDKLEKGGMASELAWQRCSVQLTKASKAHVRVFLVKNFMAYIETVRDESIKKIMRTMCLFYAIYGIHVKPGHYVEDGYVNSQQMDYIRRKIYELLAEIRPMAVPLVDAFGFRDRELNSQLGRYDGNVYPNLFKWAKESPLNEKDVLDCHYKYLIPLAQKSKI